ncbi:hypothetical protein [Agromyces archimandritae]|uniref:Uncharacterized protein n=1 Tax=Agromyces archimandritae TaxID=2781962 RepID=A0A975IPI4_9MICO|nr:hypothetical protein [Agromyces archimandritae]QTX05678.1 hypothetical protein G127AT_05590 [Agromyces archimandritae]
MLCAGALIGTLTACTPDDPKPTKTPAATADGPIFASDEEAFEAAKAAYERFHEVYTRVGESGGKDLEGIEDVATGEFLEYIEEDFAALRDQGWHTTGHSEVEYLDLIQDFETPERGAIVQITLCEDVSGLDVVDRTGASVVEKDRDPTIPVELTVEGPNASEMKVSSRWERGEFC